MNEAENQNRPVDVDAFELDPNDFIESEDQAPSLEDTKQPTTEEVSTPTEPKEEEHELDLTPFLDKLSKTVKYKDEEIKIDSLDNVVSNYQKGLNYDTLKAQKEALENSEERLYISEKAKAMGMTVPEYIKALKDYEVQQEKEQEEKELNEMVESGVAEHIARKVIETNRIAREIEQEKANIKEQKRLADEKEQKNAEYDEFLTAYPDVKVNEIPKEVFVEAEKAKISLLTAYTKYQNEQLTKELEQLKQNQSNQEKAPVKGTTEHGGVVIEKSDPFLMGFDS